MINDKRGAEVQKVQESAVDIDRWEKKDGAGNGGSPRRRTKRPTGKADWQPARHADRRLGEPGCAHCSTARETMSCRRVKRNLSPSRTCMWVNSGCAVRIDVVEIQFRPGPVLGSEVHPPIPLPLLGPSHCSLIRDGSAGASRWAEQHGQIICSAHMATHTAHGDALHTQSLTLTHVKT